jgi:hypothetical protein
MLIKEMGRANFWLPSFTFLLSSSYFLYLAFFLMSFVVSFLPFFGNQIRRPKRSNQQG